MNSSILRALASSHLLPLFRPTVKNFGNERASRVAFRLANRRKTRETFPRMNTEMNSANEIEFPCGAKGGRVFRRFNSAPNRNYGIFNCVCFFSIDSGIRGSYKNAIERPLRYSIERRRNKVEELENCSTSAQWGAGISPNISVPPLSLPLSTSLLFLLARRACQKRCAGENCCCIMGSSLRLPRTQDSVVINPTCEQRHNAR